MVELRVVVIVIELVVVELVVLVLEHVLLVHKLLLLVVIALGVSHGLDLLDELGDLGHRDQLLVEDVRVLGVELAGGVHGVGVEHQLLQQDRVDSLFGVCLLLLVHDSDHRWLVAHAEL